MIFLETGTTTIRTDQEFILSHHIEIILVILTRKIKTIEAVHQNIKDELIKYKLQIKQLLTEMKCPERRNSD